MQELLKELMSILSKELAALEKMVAAAEKQNAALRKNSTDSLNEAARELESLARQIEELKAARTRVQENMERACGLPPGVPLVDLFAAMPPVSGREEALNVVTDLREKARKLAELVRLNNLLAQNALRFCERLLKVIAPVPAAKTYLPDGAMNKSNIGLSLIDKSV
ncbi:flagellar protein FlgN [Desulfofundulus sp.]|uniref:flagellar protein FlgN n=1 Tax=Desulfofundulus sp. TaxID=2282750 RepID=UPI003C73E698